MRKLTAKMAKIMKKMKQTASTLPTSGTEPIIASTIMRMPGKRRIARSGRSARIARIALSAERSTVSPPQSESAEPLTTIESMMFHGSRRYAPRASQSRPSATIFEMASPQKMTVRT